MEIGLIGLPGSGKSTLFNILVGPNTQIKARPSGKTELKLGTIKAMDQRLDRLSEILHPPKTTYAQMSVVDMALPSTKGFDAPSIRDLDALVDVVGVFASPDPAGDLKRIMTELILADLETIQARLDKLKKEMDRGKKDLARECELLTRCQNTLFGEAPLRNFEFSEEEERLIRGYKFLTIKPMLIAANIGEDQLKEPPIQGLQKLTETERLRLIEFSGKIEMEISQLKREEQDSFRQELGIPESVRDKLVRACYQILNLISFFTVVGDEVKAWTIKDGTSSHNAAGKIHSDMARGFIRAEVINYTDFISCGSFAEAKVRGLLRLEAKEYIVKDGDIIKFRFSV